VNGEVWAFDVDGCLVDSMTGSSLRPHAAEILALLRAAGATLVLWSAGGREHAGAMAARHGFASLLDGVYDKLGRDATGRLTTTHLPLPHRPVVVVDDRPEDAPAGTRVIAVTPYMAPDGDDRGLVPLLQQVRRSGTPSEPGAGPHQAAGAGASPR
jgi:long-chain acyl-CoA synthetase